MGEGAGILVLESEKSAIKRNVNILCEIIGYGATADAFHITTPINAVPSIALGSSEVKPIEITSAYSAIANSGIYMEPIIINKIMDKD